MRTAQDYGQTVRLCYSSPMHIEPLAMAHQPLLAERFKTLGLRISEYSFANLYLFRDLHRYEIFQDRELFIRGRSYDGHTYFMPTRDIRGTDPVYLAEMADKVDYLFPIPQEWIEAFPEGEWICRQDEGEADYLFLTGKIATYAGKALHKKKEPP